ncbi:hypothetical protein K445DRAFT_307588 [Daldinia sp. EC12]|nr:hypothetical protein K445DRAFT_307588 [Daldinia sp. EC12]
MSFLPPEALDTLRALENDANNHLEWASTRFWEYILRNVVFSGYSWVVSSQQPPTKRSDDTRRVDIIIEKVGRTSVETVLFVEAEKWNASPKEIEVVEYQAYIAACAYAIEANKKTLWAMTSVGTKVRLWIFTLNREYLIPYVPVGNGLATVDEYLDAMSNLPMLIAGLEYIRDNTTPPGHLIGMTPSPRPANVVPPSNWHDNEVRQVDTYRQDIINTDHQGLLLNWRSEETSAGLATGELSVPGDSNQGPSFDWLHNNAASIAQYNAADCTQIIYGEAMIQNHIIGHMAIYSDEQWEWIADRDWQRAFIFISGVPFLGYVNRAPSGRMFYVLDASHDVPS